MDEKFIVEEGDIYGYRVRSQRTGLIWWFCRTKGEGEEWARTQQSLQAHRWPQGLVWLVAVLVLATQAVAQGVPGAPSGDGVQPTWHGGNPTCHDLGFQTGCKMDPPQSGTLECEGVTFNIDVDGKVFDWSSVDGTAEGWIAKGGPNANLYRYQPPDDADTLLHAPVNQHSGKLYGLSHIDVCGVGAPPPPPPPDRGSCCVRCEPDSGDADECIDDQTADQCAHLDGEWLAHVPCSQRKDCQGDCPVPVPALPVRWVIALSVVLIVLGVAGVAVSWWMGDRMEAK